VPMNAKGKNLGAIIIWNRQPDGMFTAGDLKLLSTMASQAAISLYNSRLIDELKESERMKRDMEIASRIQLSLLPAKAPDIDGLDLAGKCVPAMNAGGDYYDYLPLSGDELGIVIADVSGHNIVATLGIAATRGVLRSEMMRSRSPAGVLERTNNLIYDDLTAAELFISAFYAIFNCRTGRLTYSNAGHNLPFVYRAASGTCATIDTDGLLLGVLDKVDFEERNVTVGTGDILVFYTDGVTEAANQEQEQFGEERLQRIVAENHGRSAGEIIDEVFRQVYRHSAGITQYDDITMVIMKVTGDGIGADRFPTN
jgi:phosphoserine phosphatase RsbU/P